VADVLSICKLRTLMFYMCNLLFLHRYVMYRFNYFFLQSRILLVWTHRPHVLYF